MYDKNLTGEQIQTILDLYLYKALEEIVHATPLFDQQLNYLLGITTKNRKRKVSSVTRPEAIAFMSSALVASDPAEKLKYIKQARIERWFIHVFISRFLEEFAGFCPLVDSGHVATNKRQREMIEKRVSVILRSVDATSRDRFYVSVRNVAMYMKKFYGYRETIVQHYLKHSAKQASMYVKSKQGNGYVLEDVRQTIIKNVLIAIDKYDSSKGALTSYVNWWIWNAQTCAAPEHEYGIAYVIPQAHRKKLAKGDAAEVNYSVSLDSLRSDGDEDETNLHDHLDDGTDILRDLEAAQDAELIRYLVKCADPTGVVRLSLEIDEHFTEKERKRMRRITRETEAELKKRKRRRKRKV